MRFSPILPMGAVLLTLSALPIAAQDQTPATGGYGAFADIAVSDLVGLNVLTNSGENVGEIETLVKASADGDVMAVLGIGGFLGFGEHDVAVPLTELAPAEGAVLLQSLDLATLEGMPAYDGAGEALPMNTTVAGDVLEEEILPVAPEGGDATISQ
ncbi:PRC-barrel domain-containing protein [Jannaschia pohangensis]|uniref:PRC-barrel domain-containing protein n=1 Tax=Jannaschia pohangensis TaxID=390807 RepID=A0A1I3U2M1_9RHOB|nr:PRC-barrel domain-containing protein [Jannaschia pohangensis]SFJ76017.1 PRC-barrel domain-containing protein [Jannaschia pohangensis]